MSLKILAVASATPTFSLDQQTIADCVAPLSTSSGEQARMLKLIYHKTRIRARGSVLLEESGGKPDYTFYHRPAGPTDRGPSTGLRMRQYETHAGPMVVRAAADALSRSGVSASDITHLNT